MRDVASSNFMELTPHSRAFIATVKNTALKVVLPITLRLQFPNLIRRYTINIQLTLFSHLIIRLFQHKFYCVSKQPVHYSNE